MAVPDVSFQPVADLAIFKVIADSGGVRTLFGITALACLSASALAQTTARPTAAQLREAIDEVSGGKVGAHNLRVSACHGPEEEPTEFQCSWNQRIDGRWRRLTGWFFIDADGWHSQCPIGHSMECFGIKAVVHPTE